MFIYLFIIYLVSYYLFIHTYINGGSAAQYKVEQGSAVQYITRQGNSQTSKSLFQGEHVAHEIMDTIQPGCPPEHFDIKVPRGHHIFDKDYSGDQYLPFTRTNYDKASGHSPNTPRQQVRCFLTYGAPFALLFYEIKIRPTHAEWTTLIFSQTTDTRLTSFSFCTRSTEICMKSRKLENTQNTVTETFMTPFQPEKYQKTLG